MGYVIESVDIWIESKQGDDLGLPLAQQDRINRALAEFWAMQQIMNSAGDAALDKLREGMEKEKRLKSRRKNK